MLLNQPSSAHMLLEYFPSHFHNIQIPDCSMHLAEGRVWYLRWSSSGSGSSHTLVFSLETTKTSLTDLLHKIYPRFSFHLLPYFTNVQPPASLNI